jgi:cell wall-associated NlpC family hydrolase
VVVAVVSVVGLVFLLGLVVVGGTGGSSAVGGTAQAYLTVLEQSMCAATGPVLTLGSEQSSIAETVVSVSSTVSGEDPQAGQIALMTGLTESGLTNIAGGLGGAYGVFQQTPPAWGTVPQIEDPSYAAAEFTTRLVRLPHWQQMDPWVAAQNVQASGAGSVGGVLTIRWPGPFPPKFGANYEAKWSEAQRIYGAIAGQLTTSGCGAGPSGVAGPASRHGLPEGYKLPAGLSKQPTAVLAYALSKLGDDYVWGAAGPNQFDCSGLTMAAWEQAGVTLAHYTVTQEQEGKKVAPAQVQVADLVLIPGRDPPGPGLPGHVGLYIGDGLVLSAADRKDGVIVQTWQYFTSGGLDAVVDPSQPPD